MEQKIRMLKGRMDNFTYKNINVLEHWKFSYIALISADAFIEIHIYLHIRLEYST